MTNNLIFDFDGTLIDTSLRHYMVYKDILKKYDFNEIIPKEDFWKQKRKGKKTIELLPKQITKNKVNKNEFLREWIKRIENKEYLQYNKIFPDTLSVLSELIKKYNLYLLTLRNNKENLLWELQNLKLNNFFIKIITESPFHTNDKSSIIKNNLVISKNLIIIGDSETDINAGKHLNIVTVATTYGIRSKDYLKNLKPDFLINNLSEIFNVLSTAGIVS